MRKKGKRGGEELKGTKRKKGRRRGEELEVEEED